ncbi:MAG TPA: ABC transporter permease subunit [Gaiellaceae bacterium]|jgi:NitT/TauT family transport system permease protein|nr:ABC transporter permease subunit [Gaiellaceae bacterium]
MKLRWQWLWFWRAAITVIFLVAWEYLPHWGWLHSRVHWVDPFFISSPSRAYHELEHLFTGTHGPSVWPYLENTLKATFLGTAIGLAIGLVAGAVLSDSPRLAQIVAPFITMMNSIPRIALIPIVVLIVGPTLKASVVSAVLVVTFIAFFNALQGGRSVQPHVLQNARLLGANRWQIMFRVRFPYVLMWTFAALPNAIAFGLLTVVTTELLTGSRGMGNLVFSATTNVDATLSVAVVVILSVVGATIVALTEQLQRRLLHWAD